MARITFSITACMHLENGQSRAILSDLGLISQISLTATLVERFSFRYLCPNEHKGKTHYLFSVLSKIDVICFWKGSSDSLELNPQPLWSTEPVHRPMFLVAGNNINIIMQLRQREWELSWLKSTVEADWPPGHCLAGRSLAVMLSSHQWSMPCPILSPSIPPLSPSSPLPSSSCLRCQMCWETEHIKR